MDELIYMFGSVSAILLLVGHAGWLIARVHTPVQAQRPDPELTNQVVVHLKQFSDQLETLSSDVESQLQDVQERLDFAERILAKGRGTTSKERD